MSIFNIGRSLFNPVSLLQVAAGPAGWASIAMRAVVSQAVQAGIQSFGRQLGLPQFALNLMSSGAASSFGGVNGQFSTWRDAIQNFNQLSNASPFNAARNERMAEQTYDKVFESVGKMLKQARDDANGTGKANGKNWIRALVEAMGKRLDSLANEMKTLGEQVDSGAKKSGELQAVAAEFGLIQQALGTVMKSVAEGQQNLARKSG